MNLLQPDDETFMKMALREAQKAFDLGEVPVGAIVVLERQVIARSYNQVEMLKDATAHAEILAITQASSYMKNWRLKGAVLYSTKEPCAMCAGAMVNARLDKMVFGAKDPRTGAAGSALDITGFDGNLHQVSVISGVLEELCLHLLQSFFQAKRKDKKDNSV